LFGLLALSVSISLPAAVINNESESYRDSKSTLDHNALAKRYENIAIEMQTRVKEEQEALLINEVGNSPHGIKERHVNSSKLIKIRGCKHAVKENLAKAAFHRSMAAEKAGEDAMMSPGQGNVQLNKVNKELERKRNMHSL
jgi:hypothetical protein